MMRDLRRLIIGLSLFLAALAGADWRPMQAHGLTPGQRTDISGAHAPLFSWNYVAQGALSSIDSFARAGNATQFDSTGKLTYAPNNLLLNNATLATQNVATDGLASYILDCYGSGSITLSGTATGSLACGGASQTYVKISPTAGSLTLTVSGTVTNAHLAAVTYETAPRAQDQVATTSAAYYGPRFDHDPATAAALGLLVEQSATNLLPYSNILSSWTVYGSGLSLAANQGTAPDGTNSLWKLTYGGNASLYQTVATPGSGSLTLSMYAKYFDTQWAFLDVNQAADNIVWYDVQNGVVGGASGTGVPSGAISPVGNGAYRLAAAISSTNLSSLSSAPGSVIANNSTTRSGSVLAWGGQLEAGAIASSYIPTGGAAVTRAAESLSWSGYASNPVSAYLTPRGGAGACQLFASPAALSAALAGGNQWLRNFKFWPVGTPTAQQTC